MGQSWLMEAWPHVQSHLPRERHKVPSRSSHHARSPLQRDGIPRARPRIPGHTTALDAILRLRILHLRTHMDGPLRLQPDPGHAQNPPCKSSAQGQRNCQRLLYRPSQRPDAFVPRSSALVVHSPLHRVLRNHHHHLSMRILLHPRLDIPRRHRFVRRDDSAVQLAVLLLQLPSRNRLLQRGKKPPFP